MNFTISGRTVGSCPGERQSGAAGPGCRGAAATAVIHPPGPSRHQGNPLAQADSRTSGQHLTLGLRCVQNNQCLK